MKKFTAILTAAALLFALAACGSNGNSQPNAATTSTSEPPADHRYLTVSLEYEKQAGSASNQFAVWAEDAADAYVTTLFVTDFTADGGYKKRPDSLATWVNKAGRADMPGYKADAIASATPNAGALAFSWDLTDDAGQSMPDGDYTIYVEGTLRWKNYVLFSAAVAVGGAASEVTVEPQYHFEAGGGAAALTEDALECGMLRNVKVAYVPGTAG